VEVKRYDLALNVDFNNLTFDGEVDIHVDGATQPVELDAVGLQIEKVSVDGRQTPFYHDDRQGKITLRHTPPICVIHIKYKGKVAEGTLRGFYKSKYDSSYILTTQFEPNSARRLLPCIDHPSYKSVFNIKVRIGKGLQAISNTTIKHVEEDGDSKVITFHSTPKMSTYLLFLAIGHFEEAKSERGDIVAITVPGKSGKTAYALQHAGLYLDTYEQYYSIPYPANKLQLIAVPEFAAGAMENWGAITFRERLLLVDDSTSTSDRRHVALVIGHEIAHQWFGNLVTMRWWNDLWLNESFADLVAYKSTNKLFPDWDMWSLFLNNEMAGAMFGDSLMSTHPIDVAVNDPQEISQIFDEISYGKGACILRMIESFIGEEVFREGVSRYLKRFQYANATGKDLWASLEQASNQPIRSVMEAWIGKPGHPIIKVRHGQGRIKLQQTKFLLSGNQHDTWPIPLTLTVNGKEIKLLFDKDELEIPLDGDLTNLCINPGQNGFYRVHYSPETYTIIKKQIRSTDKVDRWGVVRDTFALLLAGHISLQAYLELVDELLGEKEYLVADTLSKQLTLIYLIMPNHKDIAATFHRFHSYQVQRLGLERRPNEDELNRILRERVVYNLALVDANLSRDLAEKFTTYDEVDPDLRGAVAMAFALTEGSAGYEALHEKMKKVESNADKVRILHALVSFTQSTAVEKTLNLLLSGEVNLGDIAGAVIRASRNPHGREVTWRWLLSHLMDLHKIYEDSVYMSRIMEETIPMVGLGRIEEVERELSSRSIPEAERGIKKGLELLRIYSTFIRRI